MDMMNMTQPQSERAKRLRDIQNYNFTAYDLALYLNTHPTDKKALEMHGEIVKKLDQATKEFEKDFGPLTHTANASTDTWNWMEDPWPWEAQ